MLEHEYGQEKGRKYLWRAVAAFLIPPVVAFVGVIADVPLVAIPGIIITEGVVGGAVLAWFTMGKDFQKDLDEFHQSKMSPR